MEPAGLADSRCT